MISLLLIIILSFQPEYFTLQEENEKLNKQLNRLEIEYGQIAWSGARISSGINNDWNTNMDSYILRAFNQCSTIPTEVE